MSVSHASHSLAQVAAKWNALNHGAKTIGSSAMDITDTAKDKALYPDGTVLVMSDRPSSPGVYWQMITLPRRMSILEARNSFQDELRLPYQEGFFFAGCPVDYNNDKNGEFVMPDTFAGILALIASNSLDKSIADNIKIENRVAMIGPQGSDIVEALGFYVFVQQEIPAATPGIKPKETFFRGDGSVIYEVDASGKKYIPAQTLGGLPILGALYGLGMLVSLVLSSIAIVFALSFGNILIYGYNRVVSSGKGGVDAVLGFLGFKKKPKGKNKGKDDGLSLGGVLLRVGLTVGVFWGIAEIIRALSEDK